MFRLLMRFLDWLNQPSAAVLRRRQEFLLGQVGLPDERFLAELECEDPDLQRLVLFVRRMLAAICGVEADMIHPSDHPDSMSGLVHWGFLDPLGGDGWHPEYFQSFFLLGLPAERGQPVDISFADDLPPFDACFGGKGTRPTTLGEWALQAARVILPRLPDGWHRDLPDHPVEAVGLRINS